MVVRLGLCRLLPDPRTTKAGSLEGRRDKCRLVLLLNTHRARECHRLRQEGNHKWGKWEVRPVHHKEVQVCRLTGSG